MYSHFFLSSKHKKVTLLFTKQRLCNWLCFGFPFVFNDSFNFQLYSVSFKLHYMCMPWLQSVNRHVFPDGHPHSPPPLNFRDCIQVSNRRFQRNKFKRKVKDDVTDSCSFHRNTLTTSSYSYNCAMAWKLSSRQRHNTSRNIKRLAQLTAGAGMGWEMIGLC